MRVDRIPGWVTVLVLMLFLAGIGISLCVSRELLEERFEKALAEVEAMRRDQADLRAEVDRLLRVLGAAEAMRGAGVSRGLAARIAWSVVREGEACGVPVPLILAVIAVESAFDPGAVSSAGARGLMQLMPGTARGLGVADPGDVAQNVRAGVAYLAALYRRFGRPVVALAAYHAGPTRVASRGVPAGSARYAAEVLRRADGFGDVMGRGMACVRD